MITTLGIDPGRAITAFLLARWEDGKRRAVMVRAMQADYGSAAYLLEMILRSEYGTSIDTAQVEAYDRRRRSSMTAGVSPRAMEGLIADLGYVLSSAGVKFRVRQVSQVKPWATSGGRMSRAGLVLPAKMADAESAGWHCLYTACKDMGLPDPAGRRREPDEPGIRTAGTG